MEVQCCCKILLLLFSLSSLDVYAQNLPKNYVREKDNANNHGQPSNGGHFRFFTSSESESESESLQDVQITPSSKCKEERPKNIALTLSNLGLKRIGDDFVRSEDITILRLNENKINEVSPLAFRSMPRLEELDLSANEIPVRNLLCYANCSSLRTLILDENGSWQDYVLNCLENMPVLEQLSLRRSNINGLRILFDDFAPSLIELNLSQNSISYSDFLEHLPKSLTRLYLDDNAISLVNNGVARNLIELAIDGNHITELCGESCGSNFLSLQNASMLQDLRVSRNKITYIRENTFRDTVRLSSLDLSQNEIGQLSINAFHGLRNLRHLYLGDNHLTSVPNLCPLSSLKFLKLTNNRITDLITDSFCGLSMLETLLLSANNIKTVEERAFNELSGLETLDLSDNHISKLPDNWLLPVNFLRHLLLKNNNIHNLNNLSNITHMINLEHLHVEGNPLHTVQISSISHYPLGLSMHLEGKQHDWD